MDARLRLAGSVALPILVLDQLTKWWAASAIPLWGSVEVVPGFFNLVHIVNRGSAFGFLNRSAPGWQTWFFVAASVLAVLVILHLLRTISPADRLGIIGLGGILGGAVGNLVDRVRFGEVTDFLDFYLGTWHWPAFNVADMGISIGAGLVLLSLLKNRHVPDPD